jgi:serine/threonine protein kinase
MTKRYTVGSKVGSGGFADVFAARQMDDTAEAYAMKVLKPDADQEIRKRFEREVRIQASLKHENVVAVVAMNLQDDPPWYVMHRATGNLRNLIEHEVGETLVSVIIMAARGIVYAHENGLIHRDLKPENILIYDESIKDRVARVSDFGIAREFDGSTTTITRTGDFLGTLYYAAPEQLQDSKRVDVRADVYALGKILYEALCGECPYPEMRLNRIPAKYRYLVQKACEIDPQKRYVSVKEFLIALETVAPGSETATKLVQTVENQIKSLLEASDFRDSDMSTLAKLLVENTEDVRILMGVVPNLPDPILTHLLDRHENAMGQVLREYDLAIDGGLSFEYCDVAADFYYRLFHLTDSFEVRRLVLSRLPDLGYSHNRWHVGKVFAKLVSELKDISLIQVVVDVLRGQTIAAEWCDSYLNEVPLPVAIRDEIRRRKDLSR